MNNLITFLIGKKTYLISIFFATFNLLLVFHTITLTPDQLVAIDGLFVALFGVSFRSAITELTIPTTTTTTQTTTDTAPITNSINQ